MRQEKLLKIAWDSTCLGRLVLKGAMMTRNRKKRREKIHWITLSRWGAQRILALILTAFKMQIWMTKLWRKKVSRGVIVNQLAYLGSNHSKVVVLVFSLVVRTKSLRMQKRTCQTAIQAWRKAIVSLQKVGAGLLWKRATIHGIHMEAQAMQAQLTVHQTAVALFTMVPMKRRFCLKQS